MTKITARLLALTLLLFISVPVYAANYGLSLNPPLLRINIKPGKTVTQVFTITNLTRDEKIFIARLIPFSESDSLGNPQIDLKSSAPWLTYFSLANSNIQLDQPFTLPGSSSEQLVLSLSVPQNAPLKDLYATLLISTYHNSLNPSFQGSLVSATIGSNLLITVHSEIDPPTLIKITDFQPLSGTYFRLGNYLLADNLTPISFRAQVQNKGSFTTESKGVFRLLTRQEKPVYLEGILPVYVISGNQRTLVNTHGQPFTFTPSLTTLGVHRANLQIISDNSNTTASLTLIFLPFKAGLALFVGCATLMIISGRKSRKDSSSVDTEN